MMTTIGCDISDALIHSSALHVANPTKYAIGPLFLRFPCAILVFRMSLLAKRGSLQRKIYPKLSTAKAVAL